MCGVLTRLPASQAEDGYAGVEVRVTPMRTEIIIRATRTQNVLGACSSRGAKAADPWRRSAQTAMLLRVPPARRARLRRSATRTAAPARRLSAAVRLQPPRNATPASRSGF